MNGEELPDRLEVVDSHTEGEPTRVIVGGWRELAGATMAERRDELRRHHDTLRRAVVCEPRGHEAVVGALLTPPVEPGSVAGAIFFDNAGYLGMCGHGTIGVVRTLAHLGRLDAAPAGAGVRTLRLDTPVGTVIAEIPAEGPGAVGDQDPEVRDGWDRDEGAVTVVNVPARCHAMDVTVDVPWLGRVTGDVAYGGNWFFLTGVGQLGGVPLVRDQVTALTAATLRIREALAAAGVTGDGGAEIDHVEVFGPPSGPWANSRNFVLCPGGAYDRSPCGTGTSAKLAVLHARGELALGQRWRQESITGGLFSAWLSSAGDDLVPHIRGRAFITGRTTLLFDPRDPFRGGFPAS
ncbi:MAG TPA: proline racemase family protein [Thermoanaerobaculia bacterium]|nr:proline racemase family protein [Thermoanaerobaculia bacterium]